MESEWTLPRPWVRIGTIGQAAAHADAALGVAERDWHTNRSLDNMVWFLLPTNQQNSLFGINALEVRFIMTTDGANEIIDVWSGRMNGSNNVNLGRRCTLDVECGLQNVAGSDLLHFADEIIVSNRGWPRDITPVLSGNDADGMASVWWDMCGHDLWGFHGRTPATEDCIIEISGI